MSHVFVSYSREDSEFAYRLVDDLRKEGISVWIDIGALERGSPEWKRSVQTAIENASVVVVVLSPRSKNSTWVTNEISYAKLNEVPILPVLAVGNAKESVPIELAHIDWFDARERYSKALFELTRALKGESRDESRVPRESSEALRKQLINEIVSALEEAEAKPTTHGPAIKAGYVEIRRRHPVRRADVDKWAYRATITDLDNPDVLQAMRKLAVYGWQLGEKVPASRTFRGKIDLPFLPDSRKALVRTWGHYDLFRYINKLDEIRPVVAQDVVKANETIGQWAEDQKVKVLSL